MFSPRILLALCGIGLTAAAHAETIRLANVIPAKYPEPAQLRQLVIQPFSGGGGEQLSAAIVAQLSQPDIDGKPHFTISMGGGGGRAAGTGVMSGNVTIESSQSNFTRQETRCVEGKGFFKCKRSITVNVSCAQRTSVLNISMRIVRASDRKLVYTLSEPFRDEVRWCEGQAAPSLAESYAAFTPQLAVRVAREIAPHTENYDVRLLESTSGLDKVSAKAFKSAVKIAPRSLVDACRQWQAIADSGQKNGSLSFDLGVCAEQRKDLTAASQLYEQALALSPGEKRIAEAVARARTLVTAQRAAGTQVSQRERTEAAADAADARTRQAEARAVAAAAANAKRQAARETASVVAAKAKRRADVAAKYGTDAADNIIAGTVKVGMTAAQARAVVGGGCAIQRFGAGEEVWSCRGKRIGFAKGRVTFVR